MGFGSPRVLAVFTLRETNAYSQIKTSLSEIRATVIMSYFVVIGGIFLITKLWRSHFSFKVCLLVLGVLTYDTFLKVINCFPSLVKTTGIWHNSWGFLPKDLRGLHTCRAPFGIPDPAGLNSGKHFFLFSESCCKTFVQQLSSGAPQLLTLEICGCRGHITMNVQKNVDKKKGMCHQANFCWVKKAAT